MNVLTTVLTALISTTVGVVVTAVISYFKTGKKKHNALENGTKCLLRGEIVRLHEKHIERGYCSVSNKQIFREAYEAYHALGGNGVITDLYNDIIALPENPPREGKKPKSEE